MKPFKIYLETTIFNFKFAEDSPDKKADTIKLFDEISEGKYTAYTSNYVLQELLKAEEPKRSDMVGLIEKYKIRFLGADETAEKLADEYVGAGIIIFRKPPAMPVRLEKAMPCRA